MPAVLLKISLSFASSVKVAVIDHSIAKSTRGTLMMRVRRELGLSVVVSGVLIASLLCGFIVLQVSAWHMAFAIFVVSTCFNTSGEEESQC